MTESRSLTNQISPKTIAYVGGEDVEMRIPILNRLRERGYFVSAIGSRSSTPFDSVGIDYYRYPLHRGANPFADYYSRKSLRHLFEANQPVIVHAFDTKPAILAMQAAQSVGVPCRIRTITGMGYVFSSSSLLALSLRPIYRRLQRRASAASTHTIFQNQDDQEYFLSHDMVRGEKQSLVLGSGVDVQQMNQQRPSQQELDQMRSSLGIEKQVVVSMIARLVKHKGVVEYLKAAREIVQSGNRNVRFLLIGPLASEGKQAVSRSVIDEYREFVQYLGPRKDIPKILGMTDVFVLPSYYREGVPRVLLEAGAMGLPIVTTNMPGCREVVRDGINGRLVQPRDSTQLAKAIQELINSPETRIMMGRESVSWVKENFDLSLVVSKYCDIYDRALVGFSARQHPLVSAYV